MGLQDEEGIKYACGPCITGHRAAKCVHIDRWLVGIKGAGRPLAKCPHISKFCTCGGEKIMVVMIPKNEQVGECNCRIVRKFIPGLDDDNTAPTRDPPQKQDAEAQRHTIPPSNLGQPPFLESFQPNHHIMAWQMAMPSSQPALSPSHSGFQPSRGHTIKDAIRAPQPTMPSSFGEAQSYSGLPFYAAMAPPHHVLDPSLSHMVNQTRFPATPTNPNQVTQVLRQEQSHSVTQSVSPSTIRGHESPQQIPQGTNMYSNFQSASGPGQVDNINFQPRLLPHTPYRPTVNGDYTQETHNPSTNLQSPYESIQHGHPMTLAQQWHNGRSGYHYPYSHHLNSMISPGVPSAALNALTSSHNCQCGPGCDCAFCATHPYNAATRQGVQDLHRILARDNQVAWTPIPTQSGYGDYPTNDSNIGSMAEQLHPLQGQDPLTFVNAPIQDPAMQPTTYEEDYTTMRNSQYYSVAYPVDNNFTEADESHQYNTCDCCNGAPHRGHNGLPNHGNA